MFESSNRGAPTLEFLGTGASPSYALSGPTSTGPTTLEVVLQIAQVSGHTKGQLTTVGNSLGTTGSTSGATATAVYNGGSATYLSTGINEAQTTLASPTATTAAFANSLTSSNDVYVSVTLGLAKSSGTTLTLASDALHFSPAPEPASIAILATAVGSLAAMRRRSRRHAVTTKAAA